MDNENQQVAEERNRYAEAINNVAEAWGVEVGDASAFIQDAIHEWQKDPSRTHLWVAKDDLIDEDNYGVPGSSFYRCKLCGEESGAGILNKGIQHASDCLLATPTHPVSANQPDGGWQPIETAPKDGTVILALECWIYHTDAARRPHYILREVFYNDEGGWEIVEDGEIREDDGFTHWLPRNALPASPSAPIVEGDK